MMYRCVVDCDKCPLGKHEACGDWSRPPDGMLMFLCPESDKTVYVHSASLFFVPGDCIETDLHLVPYFPSKM